MVGRPSLSGRPAIFCQSWSRPSSSRPIFTQSRGSRPCAISSSRTRPGHLLRRCHGPPLRCRLRRPSPPCRGYLFATLRKRMEWASAMGSNSASPSAASSSASSSVASSGSLLRAPLRFLSPRLLLLRGLFTPPLPRLFRCGGCLSFRPIFGLHIERLLALVDAHPDANAQLLEHGRQHRLQGLPHFEVILRLRAGQRLDVVPRAGPLGGDEGIGEGA